MIVQVVRTGKHQGELFAEVAGVNAAGQFTSIHYTVPVTEELLPGTRLNVEVTVQQTAAEADAEAAAVALEATGTEAPVDTEAPADVEEVVKAKQGKLPKSFPHQAELEEAGITTFAQVRALKGDFSEVHGIGPAKGQEITDALEGE